jgi:hypothetical protein
MSLEQELEKELMKMRLKRDLRIKTMYSNGDMPEQFELNEREYLKQVNSKPRSPNPR